MNIEYNKQKTNFRKTCRNEIKLKAQKLLSGDTVDIDLGKRDGYPGDIKVKIKESDETEFWSDYDSTDLTRFPARIKGCATALKDLDMYGKYRIQHEDGLLQVTKI